MFGERQPLLAGAWFLHAFVNPDTLHQGDLEYPGVWYAQYVERLAARAKGRHVAQALYLHLSAFGYRPARSDIVMSSGVELMWNTMGPAYFDRAPSVIGSREALIEAVYSRHATVEANPPIETAGTLTHLQFGLETGSPGRA